VNLNSIVILETLRLSEQHRGKGKGEKKNRCYILQGKEEPNHCRDLPYSRISQGGEKKGWTGPVDVVNRVRTKA